MDYVMKLFKETDERLKELYETSDIYLVWNIMRNWGWIKEVLASHFYTDAIDYETYTTLSKKADEYEKAVRAYLYELKEYSE